MAKENINPELSIDEEAQLQLLEAAQLVRQGASVKADIFGKKWSIRPTSMRQNQKMSDLDLDVMFWQRRLKESPNIKEAKRINRNIRKAYAKKAAYKVIGYRLGLIPLMHAYMWRRIYNCSEAVSATINSTESIGENKVFFLANLGSSKQTLALCMKQVGESIKQLTLRTESAESMVEADDLPTKEESKLTASSKAARTTRR
jgi:hypothetical protein